jgi:molybdate transport system substrate-binding protein
MSELINLSGIELLGPLPAGIQTLTIFSAGISIKSQSPNAARRVLEFMASPATIDLKRRFGMESA